MLSFMKSFSKYVYSEADLDYNNSQSRATIEQNDSSVGLAIDQPLKSISEYDIVFGWLSYLAWSAFTHSFLVF